MWSHFLREKRRKGEKEDKQFWNKSFIDRFLLLTFVGFGFLVQIEDLVNFRFVYVIETRFHLLNA